MDNENVFYTFRKKKKKIIVRLILTKNKLSNDTQNLKFMSLQKILYSRNFKRISG